MVYCGKPSKSCSPCRSKRTKCDLKQPSCGQCMRTGRFCTGYRLQTDRGALAQGKTAISNQSTLNQRKQNTSPSFLLLPTEASSPTDGTLQSLCCTRQRSMVPATLPLIPGDSFAYFFFNEYVFNDTPVPTTIYDALPTLFHKASFDNPLRAVILALGIACYSNTWGIPELMMYANLEYAKALNLINFALRDPYEAKKDEILLIVMLLGLYEEHNTTSKSIEPWTNHCAGALALLNLRGSGQLNNVMGLDLIHLLRIQVVVNCLVRRVEVPETLLKWSRLAREHETNEKKISESELSEIVAKYCNLQASIESFQTKIDAVDALGQALKIESELLEWASKWKAQDYYATITVGEASADVFNDHWHLYSNLFVANTWNTYRSIRILVHQIIVTQLACVTESASMKSTSQDASIHEFQLNSSKRIVVGLSHEICASVPFFMGRGLLEDNLDSRYQPRNASRARLIVWPLYVAGQTDFVSDIMRLWAAEQLERIADDVGIRKVKAFSQTLRAKQRVSARMWRDMGMDMDC